MPIHSSNIDHLKGSEPTTVLILPSFTIVENVTPQSVPDLITHYISPAPTNTSPLPQPPASEPSHSAAPITPDSTRTGTPTLSLPSSSSVPHALSTPVHFPTRPSPHKYLILLCSQKTRDARCGQSAPLLRKEFERHLRPLGLYRDLHDERPGGVGIYFISHVGGHKFAANVMVYRRENGGEAAQCIWLARVRPEDCQGIVKFTVLQGKVVKPERQLRGGFDRTKGLVSW
jgi:(2Fe-2S) ferredoxin